MCASLQMQTGSKDVLLFDCGLLTYPLMSNYTPASIPLSFSA